MALSLCGVISYAIGLFLPVAKCLRIGDLQVGEMTHSAIPLYCPLPLRVYYTLVYRLLMLWFLVGVGVPSPTPLLDYYTYLYLKKKKREKEKATGGYIGG